jgi:sugar diacid utilization regulator
MNCNDLLRLPKLKDGLKLVAGKDGTQRNIRWIYFADSVDCIKENYNVADFIHGQEFVVITHSSLTDDPALLISLIENWSKKEIAGIAINQGQICKEVVQYCDEHSLPLYELSVKLHIVDLSQIFCHELMKEESTIGSVERLFVTILTEEKLNAETILEQAGYLGVNLSGKFSIFNFRLTPESLKKVIEGNLAEIFDDLNKTLLNELRILTLEKLLVFEQTKDVVALIPEQFVQNGKILYVAKKVITRIKLRFGLDVVCGAGSSYEYIEDFKKSYKEAKAALSLSGMVPEKKDVYYYEDMGIYSLLSQITNGKFLDSFVETRIGKLTEADRVQGVELCRTLEKYIDLDCNVINAAEELNIHRNTMNYRLNKIRGILEDNLDSVKTILELKLAFTILNMRNSRIM